MYLTYEVKNAPQRKLDDCCIKTALQQYGKNFPDHEDKTGIWIQVSAFSHDSQLNRWKLSHLFLKPILGPPCLSS